ncbi:hypothetical protein NIBR502772_06185 [Pseudarthrobacter sp. NIBRBAC000502772]|uniref:hypothetical protein n=1 Tax=Pseudarthrobacter sp. NIBRBAC000502772 TaxID=2590775 RepID=UPI001131B328|nr:hypothetical protein [Pseudarthrobacter sp. NIBRBAC000502772]QDG65861.1 hypothetical protein NIBR502772_06185 [Pseudarthrobacter sp. NIBRBAC000502772]
MALKDWANGVLGGTPLDATRLNDRDTKLEQALFQLARNPEALFAGAVTYDGNGAATSAVIEWPDGVTGNYSGTASVSFPGSVSAYTVTRAGSPTVTFTQPAVTRDATTGNVTNRPPITVT